MSAPRVRLGDLWVGFVQAVADALLAAGVVPAPLLEQYGLDQRRLAVPAARLSIPPYMRLGHAAIPVSYK
ncbi:AraC family transcriptional regulator, partial [Pseudomonas aeruginosa]